MKAYKSILHETRGKTALITLNRPDKLNAWTHEMFAELIDAVTQANRDDAIGAIIVTGAGRGFCAGADIEAIFASGGPPRLADPAWISLVRNSKPLIAAVNGHVLGIGLSLILSFDVIVASDRAKFGSGFVKMGLPAELGASYYLVQRMGIGRASEFMLTGRMIDAQEACANGLSDFFVKHEDLIVRAFAIADGIAANPRFATLGIKKLVTANASEADIATVLARENALMEEGLRTADHKEAVRAFTEKRPPRFG